MGHRFDYWLGDGREDYGLEISGTVTDELEPRHTVKVNQLLARELPERLRRDIEDYVKTLRSRRAQLYAQLTLAAATE
ncbi:MAG: hypothetical protein H8E44_35245 [Planctomycetes bacterium]|nr:hypothetical protein [Planctomycetota bacterium]MBL7040575.1 hypothetical protein [Pirellulaceae bacterium]